jgi:hypothetical protein
VAPWAEQLAVALGRQFFEEFSHGLGQMAIVRLGQIALLHFEILRELVHELRVDHGLLSQRLARRIQREVASGRRGECKDLARIVDGARTNPLDDDVQRLLGQVLRVDPAVKRAKTQHREHTGPQRHDHARLGLPVAGQRGGNDTLDLVHGDHAHAAPAAGW